MGSIPQPDDAVRSFFQRCFIGRSSQHDVFGCRQQLVDALIVDRPHLDAEREGVQLGAHQAISGNGVCRSHLIFGRAWRPWRTAFQALTIIAALTTSWTRPWPLFFISISCTCIDE